MYIHILFPNSRCACTLMSPTRLRGRFRGDDSRRGFLYHDVLFEAPTRFSEGHVYSLFLRSLDLPLRPSLQGELRLEWKIFRTRSNGNRNGHTWTCAQQRL